MNVPTTPCPVGGKVPWQSGIWPIVHRKPHPVFGWLYTIHEKSGHLTVWANVSQEDIVRKMEAVARFRVNAMVELGPLQRRRILQRKWNFEKGVFTYLIEGNHAGRDFAVEEDRLVEQVKGVDG